MTTSGGERNAPGQVSAAMTRRSFFAVLAGTVPAVRALVHVLRGTQPRSAKPQPVTSREAGDVLFRNIEPVDGDTFRRAYTMLHPELVLSPEQRTDFERFERDGSLRVERA